MPLTKITAESSQVLLVDIQTNLFSALNGAKTMLKKSLTLLTASQSLGIPVTAVEQNPKGLGKTIEPLRGFVGETFTKSTFSAFEQPFLVKHLNQIQLTHQRHNLILIGSEAHVCLLQTALGAKRAGYNTVVAWDATASRYEQDRDIAKHRLLVAQCTLVTVESLVFEWLDDHQHAEFKALIKMIKQH